MEGRIASAIFSLQFKLLLRPKFDPETPFLDQIWPRPVGQAIPWWLATGKLIPRERRKGFDSLFFLTWEIQEEAELWCLGGNRRLVALLAS